MEDNIIILGPSEKDNVKAKALDSPKTGNEKKGTSLIAKSRGIIAHPKSFQHLWLSFVHAFRWSQLKRRLTVASFKKGMRKHWFGTAAIVLLAIIFIRYSPPVKMSFDGGQGNQIGQQANLGLYPELMGLEATSPVDSEQEEEKADISEKKEEARNNENKLDKVSIPSSDSKPKEKVTELPVASKSSREDYINRFIKVARDEMKKYGIPASVTLGIAVLASDFGNSTIATKGNNHLGVTCQNNLLREGVKSQVTHGGVCFTHYKTSWAGFRANSLLLTQGNYLELGKVAGMDYIAWASGLDKIGYNAPNFSAEALISTIEKYELQKLDAGAI